MRISDWSSDVCSSDLQGFQHLGSSRAGAVLWQGAPIAWPTLPPGAAADLMLQCDPDRIIQQDYTPEEIRSEEHTSELQSLMRISYAVFCLKKKKTKNDKIQHKIIA